MLASPPGTSAPLGAINYTPKTGQIHPPGIQAPIHELNYSLLPADGSVGGQMGMGAGAAGMPAPPIMPGQERMVGRYGAPASMASGMYQPGTPPMRPSPYGTGPGPRLSPSGPSPSAFSGRSSMQGAAHGWGQGMGMGAGQSVADLSDDQLAVLQKMENGEQLTPDEQQIADNLESQLPDVKGGQVQSGQAQGGQPQQAQPAQQTQQSGGGIDETAAIGAVATADENTRPPTGWHSEGAQNDQPNKPSQLWWVSDDGAKRMYIGSFQYGLPGTPPSFKRATAAEQQQISTGIDWTKAKAKPNLQTKNIYNPDTKQTEIWNWDPATGQKVGDKPVGIVPPPKASTASQKMQVIPGVGVFNPDGTQNDKLTTQYLQSQQDKTSSSTATEQVRAQEQLSTDKPYSTFVAKDGATWLLDTETGDSYPITPADPLNGIFTAGNQLVQVDPDTNQANVVYSAPHNWSVTTSGGTTIAYDPQDPTKHQDIATDPTYAPQAAATLASTQATLQKTLQDVQNGKITGEDARAKLAIQAHDLLHPQPTIVGGNIITPSGAELDINYASIPGMPQRPSQHVSGGPLDPESAATAKHIMDFLDKLDAGQQPTDAAATKQPAQAQQQDQGKSAALSGLEGQVQAGSLLAPGMAGTAAGDPLLSKTGVPSNIYTNPTQRFTPAGGSDYSYAASPWDYGEPPPTPQKLGGGDWNAGSSLNVGLTPDDTGSSDSSDGLGGGQEDFMGRGLTPASGRGSTGIGWQPKTPGWQPGSGHTSAGGRGGGGAAGGGGAGQEMPQPPTPGAAGPPQPGPQPQPPAPGMPQPGGQGQPAGQNDPRAAALIQWLTELNQKLAAMGERLGIRPGGGQQPGGQQPGGGAGQDETMPPGGPPAAPQPGGAPPPGGSPQAGWTPPVNPSAVAGIGHRFGQSMDQGEPQHSGIDLQAPEGTPTVSPVDGMVERVEHNPKGLGLTVVLRGKDGSEHRLGHLSRTDAYPGMQVVQGQDLQSHVGSTGNTTGAHLHWGVRDQQGQPQDPTGALPPQTQGMPPVPGTEMMGPPGGNGGQAQAGAAAPPPPGGAGQDSSSPDYQAGYQAGIQASKSPGTPPIFVPAMQQPIPSSSDSGGGGDGQQQGQMGGGQDTSRWAGRNAPHLNDPLFHFAISRRSGQRMGGGQDSADSRWDLYEAKDTSGFWGPPGQPDLGSGGEGGMGAGGVYVKYPDGSMHWDETKADPNPNGGSVISSTTGQAISGANRQSGPTGPGGTGPAGSQAQAAHAAELQANPSFASTPSSPFLSNAWQTMGANYGQPSAYGQFAGALPGPPGPGGSVVGAPGTAGSALASQIMPLSQIQQQEDPFSWNQKVLSNPVTGSPSGGAFDPSKGTFDPATGKPKSLSTIGSTLNVGLTPSDKTSLGTGGESGMGAGAVVNVTPDTQATIDAQVQVAQMQVNEQAAAATQSYNASMAQVNANIAAESNRHAEAIAGIQQQYAFHADDVALKQQEDQENQRHNSAQEQLQAQATQMQQTVESMREANSVQLQQMQEGTQVYLQQGDQAFKDWQTTQADRMSILSSALSNPWLQQLTGMSPAQAGASVGGQNISNLINQILQPYNAQAYGMQNAPSAMNAPSTAGGVAPGATGSQPTAAQMGMQSGAQSGTPTWSQWQGWNPFQMAAYRTNIEALGPGAWNQAQQGMQNTFAQQGGSPNVTAMQAAAATPEQSAGQQMTANVFGQTVPEWQQQQSKQWSQAQAPQVKSNLTGIAA